MGVGTIPYQSFLILSAFLTANIAKIYAGEKETTFPQTNFSV